MTEYTDEIYDILDDYTADVTASIEDDIAQCRPVYDSVTRLVRGPCEYFLNPFNTFWFCMGWFLSFGIMAIVSGTCLIGIFRSKAIASSITAPAPHEDIPMVYYPDPIKLPRVPKTHQMQNVPKVDYM